MIYSNERGSIIDAHIEYLTEDKCNYFLTLARDMPLLKKDLYRLESWLAKNNRLVAKEKLQLIDNLYKTN